MQLNTTLTQYNQNKP